jgi:hypothetical protein
MIVDTPLGRPVTTDELAAAVAFFASDSAALITGQVLSVDGGMFMGWQWWTVWRLTLQGSPSIVCSQVHKCAFALALMHRHMISIQTNARRASHS